MRLIRRVGLQGGCALLLGGPVAAQQAVTPLAIEDALNVVELPLQGGLGAISPDGALLAYAACDPRRVHGDSTGMGTATVHSPMRSQGCDLRVTVLADGTTRTIATSDAGGHWGPAWSPDGRRLAFYSDRDGRVRVWLWERAAGRLRRAAAAEMETRTTIVQPLWTPDGRALVVQLLASDLPRSVLTATFHQQRPAPPADAVPGATLALYRSTPPTRTADTAAATPPTGSAGGAAKYVDLGLLDLATGRVRRLRPQVMPLWSQLSPDGRWLAYLETGERQHAALDEGLPRLNLRLVELATGRDRTVATEILQGFGAVTWAPNSRYLAYVSIPRQTDTLRTGTVISSPIGRVAGGAAELYVVSVEGGAPRRFAGAVADIARPPLWSATSDGLVVTGQRKLWRARMAGEPPADGAPASDSLAEVPAAVRVEEIVRAADRRTYWSPDGGTSLYVLTTDSSTLTSGYVAVDLRTGATRELLRDQHQLGRGSNAPLVTPRGDAVVFLRESAERSPDLWVAGADFAAPRRLTTLNPQFDRYTFGKARLVDYRSHDGTPLRGALLLPAGYEPGKRYPLVVWVYASQMGSRSLNQFGLVGYYNLHLLSTRGYAVLWPDIPVHVGTPMRDLMKSVMPAIDKVVELGIADPERLAVMGHSNGGYSTLALLVQTTRFKAAVMNAGFGDLTGMYGYMNQVTGSGYWQSLFEQRSGAMGVPPWAAPLRYVENSPVFYLDRVQTPLIIQAGSKDLSVVPFSDQVFTGLKRLQKDVTYLRYGGEGHVLMQHPNLVDYWKRVLAFLDAKLTGEPAGVAQSGRM